MRSWIVPDVGLCGLSTRRYMVDGRRRQVDVAALVKADATTA
jgi:hypothetical protein